MIFSPLFGYWANKVSSIRTPFIVSLGVFCCASAVYSCLDHVETNAKYWMLAARFFVGVSSANVVICRSYLSAATTLKERTQAISFLTLAQTLGKMWLWTLRKINFHDFMNFLLKSVEIDWKIQKYSVFFALKNNFNNFFY